MAHQPHALRRTVLYITLAAAGLAGGWLLAGAKKAPPDLVKSAEDFLASLSENERAKAVFDFDTPRRAQWHYIPLPERKGIPIGQMNDRQRTLAKALLQGALSDAGYDKAMTIMELEDILRELERGQSAFTRDRGRYYFALFGSPAAKGRWQLSIEGHHLSLNFVVADGKVISHTPAFFGANPAEVKSELRIGPKKGTRPLAKEEMFAFELLASLSADQAKRAVIAEKAPGDIRAGGQPQPPHSPPAGLPLAELKPEQQEMLLAIIRVYTGNMLPEVAEGQWREIRDAGTDKIHFAWAGARKPGIGHYYRIQGPTFVIELCNTQPDAAGNPANHVHAVLRSLKGDFAMKPGA